MAVAEAELKKLLSDTCKDWDDGKVQTTLEHLIHLGVQEIIDVEDLEFDDINEYLTKIEFNRMKKIAALEGNKENTESSHPSGASTQTVDQASTSTVIHSAGPLWRTDPTSKQPQTKIDSVTPGAQISVNSRNAQPECVLILVRRAGVAPSRFKVKSDMSFVALMRSYCESNGITLAEARFRFDGVKIQPEETPARLGMSNGDVLDCHVDRTGEQCQPEHVNIRVDGLGKGVSTFKIKRDAPLNKLMNQYGRKHGLQARLLRFTCDDGTRIKGLDTVDSLGLEDNDIINVFSEADGGAHFF